MTPRAILLLRALTVSTVGALGLAADWSAEAAVDPARLLFLGPRAVLIASQLEGALEFPAWLFVAFLLVGVAHVETGLALSRRRPDSAVGLLLVVAGLLWLAQGLRRSSDPTLFTTGALLTNAYNPVLLHILLSLPGGRLHRRVDKVLVVTGYVYFPIANVTGWLLVDHSLLLGAPTPRNLAATRQDPDLWENLSPALNGAAIVAGAVVLYVLISRYVVGTPLYRHAFAPLWVAGIGKVAGNVIWSSAVWFPGVWPYAAYFAGSAGIPAAVAVSVVRGNPSARTMKRVVEEMGHDVPDADEFRDSLRRTTADPSLDLLRFDEDRQAYVTLAGDPVAIAPAGGQTITPLSRGGHPIGAVVHDRALADSLEVLRAVKRMALLVLDNERLLAQVQNQLDEVRRSRLRILEAGDAERARIERNLHDAVQQRLVGVALLLRRAEREPLSSEVAKGRLEQGAAEVERALRELRDIVRGMNPAIVDERGLAGALESMAERSAVAVRFSTDVAAEALPLPLLATTYYVVAEAVTNAQKHAAASVIDVSVRVVDGALRLSIRDDGRGGAMLAGSGGLRGLRDRVEAGGGALELRSSPASGTEVRAVLPVAVSAERSVP